MELSVNRRVKPLLARTCQYSLKLAETRVLKRGRNRTGFSIQRNQSMKTISILFERTDVCCSDSFHDPSFRFLTQSDLLQVRSCWSAFTPSFTTTLNLASSAFMFTRVGHCNPKQELASWP